MDLLTFILQPDSAVPLYKQLYNFIKNEIKNNSYKPHDKLPSKRHLSEHLKISQNTVETAYQQLVAEGYIKSVPKSGFFVCNIEDFAFEPSYYGVRTTNKKNIVERKDNKSNAGMDIAYKYEAEQDKEILFDFKTNTVDTASFPFSTWAKISREIMHDENTELLKAVHSQGDYALRECITEHLHQSRGVKCNADQIIIGAGTEYLLGLLVQILGRDNIFAIENPGYSKTYMIFKSNDVVVNLISLDNEGMSIYDLEQSSSNIAYITPSHQYPLGIIMPIRRRLQILKWANQKPDRYIIEDDYDSEFRFNGRPIPALQGIDINNKVVYLSTFSKSIAPSMRISYMVLPPDLLQRYKQHFSFYSSTVSRFEQYTLYRFIHGGYFERHLNRMRNIYRNRKDKLIEELKNSTFASKIKIIGENAGLHLLLEINCTLSEKEVIDRAEKEGVKLYGLSGYYMCADDNLTTSSVYNISNEAADGLCKNNNKDISPSTVVLGYSNLEIDKIVDAVKLLNKAWEGI